MEGYEADEETEAAADEARAGRALEMMMQDHYDESHRERNLWLE